jgi:predicted Zn-ribbon and HTH transcriptional regulator
MALTKVNPVKVRCRNCGNEAFADDFKLDNIKGTMVCPGCSTRPNLQMIDKEVEENSIDDKPVGWDEVDDYLEKAYREKKSKEPGVLKSESEDGYVHCVCKKCQYGFRYNTIKKWPHSCPSCGREVNS